MFLLIPNHGNPLIMQIMIQTMCSQYPGKKGGLIVENLRIQTRKKNRARKTLVLVPGCFMVKPRAGSSGVP